MTTQNGRGKEVILACRNVAGVIELNDAGIPVVFRRRCKNKECCPPRDGCIAIHRWTIYGTQNDREPGEYKTEYVPMRSADELVGELTDHAAVRRT